MRQRKVAQLGADYKNIYRINVTFDVKRLFAIGITEL